MPAIRWFSLILALIVGPTSVATAMKNGRFLTKKEKKEGSRFGKTDQRYYEDPSHGEIKVLKRRDLAGNVVHWLGEKDGVFYFISERNDTIHVHPEGESYLTNQIIKQLKEL